MQPRTWAIVVSGCAIAAGCAAIAGIEETTTIAVEPEASVASDAGDASDEREDLDEIADAGEVLVDASLCADAAARVRGVSAAEVETIAGLTCPSDPKRILDLDDQAVGLDSIPDAAAALGTRWWVDHEGQARAVQGCVGVQFDGGLSAVMVRARMTGQGCQTNCESSFCNTYRYVGVWVRGDDGGMKLIGTPQFVRGNFSDKVVQLADGGTMTNPFVVTCRTSLAYTRDDIEVDYIGGCP